MVWTIRKISLLLFSVVMSTHSYGISIEEAYAAVPHQRTVFDNQKSLLEPKHIQGLNALFNFTDKCLVLRIEGLTAIQSNNIAKLNKIVVDYQLLIQSFEKMNFSMDLKSVQQEVLGAVRQHQHFFVIKGQGLQGGASLAFVLDQDVNQSSEKLKVAYSQLMRKFSAESAVNKQAFFDYLCALDFK